MYHARVIDGLLVFTADHSTKSFAQTLWFAIEPLVSFLAFAVYAATRMMVQGALVALGAVLVLRLFINSL